MKDSETQAALRPGGSYAELPGRRITPNQIVAWNLNYFRKVAELTQEEFGHLVGWSKAIVSAAERSWDSKRVRQFSADDIVRITTALGIPVIAMFLPPDDDGVNERYHIDLPRDSPFGGGAQGFQCYQMHDLMLHVVPDELTEPEDGDSTDAEAPDEASVSEGEPDMKHARQRYWERYVAAVNSYLRADRIGELAGYLENAATEEGIVEHISRLRAQYDALRGLISDNDHLQAALYERLDAVRTERHPWRPRHEPVTEAEREDDRRFGELIKEIYGSVDAELTQAQVERAVAEANRRGIWVEQPGARGNPADAQ